MNVRPHHCISRIISSHFVITRVYSSFLRCRRMLVGAWVIDHGLHAPTKTPARCLSFEVHLSWCLYKIFLMKSRSRDLCIFSTQKFAFNLLWWFTVNVCGCSTPYSEDEQDFPLSTNETNANALLWRHDDIQVHIDRHGRSKLGVLNSCVFFLNALFDLWVESEETWSGFGQQRMRLASTLHESL